MVLFRLILPSNAAHVNMFSHDFSSSRVPDRADGIRSAGSRRSIAALEPPAERVKDGPAYLRTIAATAGRTGGLGPPVGGSADGRGVFPRQVRQLLTDALALPQPPDNGQTSPHGLPVAVGHLEGHLALNLAPTVVAAGPG